jgi:hypothetical protein
MYMRKITIVLPLKDKDRNGCLEALNVPEARKLIKKETKVDVEKIFDKKK